jgi:hypothetical protein
MLVLNTRPQTAIRKINCRTKWRSIPFFCMLACTENDMFIPLLNQRVAYIIIIITFS